ncbi:MAG: hypothetical protein QOE93_1470, partial [Actinomycetota bacterium]|nr:hypothetical protein [Actinomycetota bacterium]
WSFRPSLLVFDLSGRGLAEFYSACLAIGSIGRPVWLVVHDAPELVGPPLLLKGLDRRGGRRLGMYLSRTVGARLETWMMGRADTVFALSGLGAAALRERTGGRVRVRQLPIPIEDQSESDKQPIVYCPSSVSAVDVVPVVRALASASSSWTLRLGNMDGPEQAAVEAAADRAGILDRLEFIGRVDEVRLDESYEDAAVVVRNRGPGSSPENWAAVSGPVISAMAAGCAVIATDARGSSACLEAAGGVDLGDRPDDLERDLGRLLGDEGERARLGEAGRRHVRGFHTPERVARHLADAWAHTAERLSPRAT